MLIQVEPAPAVLSGADRPTDQLPELWSKLKPDLQSQLVKRWANLVHQLRQRRVEGKEEDEHGSGC